MMGQGGYEQWEEGLVKELIKDLNKETDPAVRSIVPLLEQQLKNPKETKFETDLVTTLRDLNVTLKDIKERYLPQVGTKQNDEIPNKSWWQKTVDWIAKAAVTAFGSPSFGYSGGGYLRGPGTGTSDSIPGYITGFADGGAVPIRVSNTEYITRSASVQDITVPNMDLINERGAEGVVMAAQNILGIGAATGGYVNKLVNYAMGSTGGLPKISPQKKFNFNKLDDRMTYAMKHLISKGMTAEAAAGIVGNLIAESTLRTGAMEAGHTREGRGIAQWGVNARWKTYQNWLKKNGRKDIYDLANQLDFIWWEMHNGQLADPNKFKTLTNISRAAYLFMDQYERPGVLRWKERNTWAYKAYKQYTGKDYVDVASTLYPGPDKAKSDYAKGLSSPSSEMLPEDPEKFISPMIIPGVSKVSALGFARGGYLGFKNGSQKGLNISKGKYNKLKDYFSQFGDMSVNFQTDKHDLYPSEIQELREIAQKIMGSKPRPSSMNVVGYADQRGSTKYNMALSRRRAKYVAQILSYLAPGIDFNPIALGEESGKYSQLAMSKKRRVSIELPPRVGGGLSLPYEPKGMGGSSPFEGIFPGGGFQGLMTLAKGGYLGFKNGGAPHEMGMRNQVPAKKINWLQENAIKMLGLMGKGFEKTNPIMNNLITKDLIRRYAEIIKGSGTKGDFASLAIAPIPLVSPAKTGVNIGRVGLGLSKLSPTAKSFAMTKIDEEAMEALVKLNIDDLIKMMPAEETDVMRANLFKAKEFLTNTKKLNPQNKTLEEWLSSAMSGYETMSSTEKFTKFQGIHQVLQVLREVDLLKSSPKLAKHWNEILQKPYSFTPGRTDIDGNIITEAMAKARIGKFNINTSLYNEEYAKRFYGLSGSDEVSLFKGVGDIDPAKSYMGNNSGWKVGPGGLGTYFTTNPNIAKSFADSVGAWIRGKGGTGGIFETSFKISDLPEILMNAGGTYSEWAQVISPELMKKILAAKNMRPFDWNAPRLAGGGYMKDIRKFHDWNGPIPGAYGSEVAAILQAGREGVYDTDYVSALKNGTMNPTTGNSKVINVGSVQMTFTEPVTNGKQIFNEFKALLSFENNASNSNMNLGVGA
jgi:outer membrane protein OmpA-like peptidoglycan-associated protein